MSALAPCHHWDTSRRRCLAGHRFPADCNPSCADHFPVDRIPQCLHALWHQLTGRAQ